jgi:hypothetical protein
MFTNRKILIGICAIAIVAAGFYFSSNEKLDELVNGSDQSVSSLSVNATASTSIKNCPFEASSTPAHGPIIINEIAWMGDAASSNDEWIELKNLSSSTTSMGGWELVNQNEKIKVVFKSGAKITAGDFYLLERGGSDFLPGIKADTFFIGSLKNSGDSFRLFDKDCGLIDEVMASGKWPAGDNTSKKTMERDSKTLAWHTSKIVGGTPKEENDQVKAPNSKLQVPNKSQIPSNNNQTDSSVIPAKAGIQSQTSRSVQDDILTSKSNVNHILISQVQITGGKGKTDDDFIEVYNPNGLQVNLKGYRLVKRAQNSTSDTLIKSWTTDTFIPVYGFYLWANSSFTNISATPDSMTYETLSDDNGSAIRLGPNDTGTIVDSVAWGKAQNVFATSSAAFPLNPFPLNPNAGQSLLRKSWQNGACLSASLTSLDSSIGNGCETGNNAEDFELEQVARPRNTQSR